MHIISIDGDNSPQLHRSKKRQKKKVITLIFSLILIFPLFRVYVCILAFYTNVSELCYNIYVLQSRVKFCKTRIQFQLEFRKPKAINIYKKKQKKNKIIKISFGSITSHLRSTMLTSDIFFICFRKFCYTLLSLVTSITISFLTGNHRYISILIENVLLMRLTKVMIFCGAFLCSFLLLIKISLSPSQTLLIS